MGVDDACRSRGNHEAAISRYADRSERPSKPYPRAFLSGHSWRPLAWARTMLYNTREGRTLRPHHAGICRHMSTTGNETPQRNPGSTRAEKAAAV